MNELLKVNKVEVITTSDMVIQKWNQFTLNTKGKTTPINIRDYQNLMDARTEDEASWNRLKSPRTLKAMKNLQYTKDDLKPFIKTKAKDPDTGKEITYFEKVSPWRRGEIKEKVKKIIKERADIIRLEDYQGYAAEIDDDIKYEMKRDPEREKKVDELEAEYKEL